MIHGGAVNEYEFIFTPDGPEKYLDLTQVPPTESRAGVAQHMASLGIPVLAVSLPGHYSRNRGRLFQNEDRSSSSGRFPEMRN